jgi:hypothetical protein
MNSCRASLDGQPLRRASLAQGKLKNSGCPHIDLLALRQDLADTAFDKRILRVIRSRIPDAAKTGIRGGMAVH